MKKIKKIKKIIMNKKGALGVDQALAIAAALIVAGLIIIPELKDLGTDIMDSLSSWWESLSTSLFTA